MNRNVLGVYLAMAACLVAACDPTSVSSWPEIATSGFPPGSVGVPYSASIDATAGKPPYRFALSGGALPSGLSLAEDGTLSGTPLQADTASFTVQVTDAANATASRALTLVIQGGPLTPLTTTLPDGQLGVAYDATLSATGGAPPYVWTLSSGTLPAGLTLSESGAITGTPGAAGASSFVVMVTDSALSPAWRERTLTITITGTTSSAPLRITTTSLGDGSVGVAYAAQLGSGGGTTPVSWTLEASSNLPPGLTLSPNGAVTGTPTVAGQFEFSVIAADNSVPRQFASATLAISVTSTSSNLAVSTPNLPPGTVGSEYSQQLNASGGSGPYTWTVAAGAVPTGLTLSSAGLLSGLPSASGSFTFTVQVADSSVPTQLAQSTFAVTIKANPSSTIAVVTGNLAVGTVGSPYHAQLQAVGGTAPYSWAITAGALPGGLTLAPDGSIDGTPSATGAFDFIVEASDSSSPIQTASKHFTLTISGQPGKTLSITTATLPNGEVGVAYDEQLVGSGGAMPYRFTLVGGALPPGIVLAANGNGTLAGVPTTSGAFSFTIRLTDNSSPAQWVERSYHVMVAAAPGQVAITNSNLPSGRVGAAYNVGLNANGGTAPYHWTLRGGSLPGGLTLADDGLISGTPTASGTFTFTVTVVDSATVPKSASKELSLVVR